MPKYQKHEKTTEIQSGTVARYCKPMTLDENKSPTDASFRLREREKSLSVYLLDFFNRATEKEGVIETRDYMAEKTGFKIKPSGAFALLDIKESKEYVFQVISEKISYKELNLPHCGIFYEYDDMVISELLAQCVKKSYILREL